MKYFVNPPKGKRVAKKRTVTMMRRGPDGRFIGKRKGGRPSKQASVVYVNAPERKTRRKKKRGGTVASKMPERYKSGPKKGQFKPKSSRRKTTAKRTRSRATTKKRSTTRRRTARRNPPRRKGMNLIDTATRGVTGAMAAVAGKAASRALPSFAGLPTTGNVGMAVEALSAVVLGGVADRFVGGRLGEYVLVGGLMGPLERVIASLDVPVLSPALSGYVPTYRNPFRSDYPRHHMGAYPASGTAGGRLAAYANNGLGAYAPGGSIPALPVEAAGAGMYR